MNKTGVEYADYSWNPITGCFHDCPYCYARKIAQRFARRGRGGLRGKNCETNTTIVINEPMTYYDKSGNKRASPYPYGFDPTFHRYRLTGSGTPAFVKKPSTIFVGDMADMFGEWVSTEWITAVFNACQDAPQHRYLFLTKNPTRYAELKNEGLLRPNKNFWFGTTVTGNTGLYFQDDTYNTFLSVEPILEDIGFGQEPTGADADWVIIGADTSRRKDKVVPRREWIARIVDGCRLDGTPVFLKNNLSKIWGENLIQEYPKKGGW